MYDLHFSYMYGNKFIRYIHRGSYITCFLYYQEYQRLKVIKIENKIKTYKNMYQVPILIASNSDTKDNLSTLLILLHITITRS